jgi:hypothetical protein
MPDSQSNIASELKDANWRTGSVIAAESVHLILDMLRDRGREDLCSVVSQSNCWVIVLSQWCDLLHPSLDAEPNVEIFVGIEVSSTIPENIMGRSPRYFDLLTTRGPLRIAIRDRATLPRATLTELRRCLERELEWDQVGRVTNWVARRYTRFPLPDELNRRLAGLQSGKQKKQFKILNEKSLAIRFGLTPPHEELDSDSTYYLTLVFVVRRGTKGDAQLAKAYDEFRVWTLGLTGVVATLTLLDEDEFTYAQMRTTFEWPVDEFSLDAASGLPTRGANPRLSGDPGFID